MSIQKPPTVKVKRDRHVKVDRNAWSAIVYILVAQVFDDMQDTTGWQWLAVVTLTARVMAVLYVVLWLATRNRDAA